MVHQHDASSGPQHGVIVGLASPDIVWSIVWRVARCMRYIEVLASRLVTFWRVSQIDDPKMERMGWRELA